MTSAQVVETSVNVTLNSPSQDYTHPDDRTLLSYDMTPGFNPFTIFVTSLTTAGGSELERGFAAVSGLTGPVTCWARSACLTRSAWFWGSLGLGVGLRWTGFGDNNGGGILRLACGGDLSFPSLLSFLCSTRFSSGGFRVNNGGGILRLSCGGDLSFGSLLFFLSSAGFSSGGFPWLSKTLLERNKNSLKLLEIIHRR